MTPRLDKAMRMLLGAFKQEQLAAFTEITLASSVEGHRFLQLMHNSCMSEYVAVTPAGALSSVVHGTDGSVWGQCEFSGVRIKWPAQCRIDSQGKSYWL